MKRTIRVTESELRKMIESSVHMILNESRYKAAPRRTKEETYRDSYFLMSRYIMSRLEKDSFENVTDEIMDAIEDYRSSKFKNGSFGKGRYDAMCDFFNNTFKWVEKAQKVANEIGKELPIPQNLMNIK